MLKKLIYLDHAATTPIDLRVASVMQKITLTVWGNPSSSYASGKKARQVIEDARKEIASMLGVKAGEIIFTGSGTESDNLAILGVVEAYASKGRHIITSAIEHMATKQACEKLARYGFEVTFLPVNVKGLVDPDDVEKALRKNTILVSIMQANNEIGTIQPIREISKVIEQHRKKYHTVWPIFHTDACQSAGFLNIQPHALGVDLLTFNGSKIYGPKGTGVLYKKNNIEIQPMLVGGSQENGWRAGTENVSAAVGLALALDIAEKEKKKESGRLIVLRDNFIQKVLKEITDSRLNGDAKKRLPNNINLSFKGIDGEMLVLALDRHGIEVSTGSACTTAIRLRQKGRMADGPSHVLKAIGNPKGYGNVRITLGRRTTRAELKETAKVLKKEVARLRAI